MKTLISGVDSPLDTVFIFAPFERHEEPQPMRQFAETQHSGILVALWLDPETAAQLPQFGAVDPADMHITVLYDPDAGEEELPEFIEELQRVAAGFDPLDGVTSGFGRFYGGEKDVIIALPDIKGLDVLRDHVRAALGRNPSEHGYTPHITLGYISRAAPTPFSELREFHASHDQKSHGRGRGAFGTEHEEWAQKVATGEDLTGMGYEALARYGAEGQRVNAALRRGETLSEEDELMIEQVDVLFATVPPLAAPLTVYRAAPKLNSNDEGYVSTSIERQGAEAYGGEVWAIEIPAGSKVIPFDLIFGNTSVDSEILLPRQTRMTPTGNREARAFHEPQQFFNPLQTRDRFGKWTKGGGDISAAAKAFDESPREGNYAGWRKKNQKLYETDPEFRAAVDATTAFTHGSYQDIRLGSIAAIAGQGLHQEVGVMRDTERPLVTEATHPMARYPEYFKGQQLNWRDSMDERARALDPDAFAKMDEYAAANKGAVTSEMANYRQELYGRALDSARAEAAMASPATVRQGGAAMQKVLNESTPMTEAIYRGETFDIGRVAWRKTQVTDWAGQSKWVAEPHTRVAEQRLFELANLKGKSIDVLGMSSFTRDEGIAQQFADRRNSGQYGQKGLSHGQIPVTWKVEPGAKAINAAPLSRWKQKEVITSGRFEVTDVKVKSSDNNWGGLEGKVVNAKMQLSTSGLAQRSGGKILPDAGRYIEGIEITMRQTATWDVPAASLPTQMVEQVSAPGAEEADVLAGFWHPMWYEPEEEAPEGYSEEPQQFHVGGSGHVQSSHGSWAKFKGCPPDLDPRKGIRMDATGYAGGFPPFRADGASNKFLSPENEHKRLTPVDTDRILALREYNAKLPETYSIADDAPTWYDGKVMTRQEMRNQIADEFLSGKHDGDAFSGYAQDRTIDIYMGPPAAGKSGTVAKMGKPNSIEIDADRIKTVLPEFNNGKNANGVHEESSAINTAVLDGAMARGYRIAMPIVGKSEGSVKQILSQAEANGYKVNLHLVTADTPTILGRMRTRIDDTGRFVDPKYMQDSVKDGPSNTFRSLRNDPRVSSSSVWSTSPRAESNSGFPAQRQDAAAFAEVGSREDGPMGVGGGADGSIFAAGAGSAGSGIHNQVLSFAFNPSQPRASDGKWTISGAGVRSFKDDAEGKAFLQSHYAGWRTGLTSAEDKGMTFYQSPGYELMNGRLRGTELRARSEDIKRADAAVKGLDSAIKKAPPLEQDTEVYRGFSAAQFGTLKAGMTVQDKGYVSTALTEAQAGSFTARGSQAIARITLPKGTKAAGGSQKELVLPRNARFNVTAVRKSGGKTYVEMTYVL